MKIKNGEKQMYVWTWDPVLVMYHDTIARCYKNIEMIQTSIWGKIFRKLAKRKLDAEYSCMQWACEGVEDRIAELESTYNDIKVVRFNSISGEWVS